MKELGALRSRIAERLTNFFGGMERTSGHAGAESPQGPERSGANQVAPAAPIPISVEEGNPHRRAADAPDQDPPVPGLLAADAAPPPNGLPAEASSEPDTGRKADLSQEERHLQTEYEFVLPRGYVDESGRVHTRGRIRLATALDETESMLDPRVQANTAYLPIILLSRVVIALGDLPAVTPQVIGGLFAADLAYLEDLYQRLNSQEQVLVGAVCPYCSKHFHVQVAPLV